MVEASPGPGIYRYRFLDRLDGAEFWEKSMNVETGEIIAVIAAMMFAITLGLIVIVALQPSKGVFAKIARFFLNRFSAG